MISSLNLIIGLGAIIFLSILVVSVANLRESQRRSRLRRLNGLKRRINWLENLVNELEPLLEESAVVQLINTLILEEISRVKKIDAGITSFNASQQAALARAEILSDQESPHQLDRLKESDSQIAIALKGLEDAAVLVRRQEASNNISPEQMQHYLRQLNWSHLMVRVISHIGQGHKAARRKNILSAKAFYKKAQQLLLGSALSDQRRQDFIRQITELIADERRAISDDLMPETHLNP